MQNTEIRILNDFSVTRTSLSEQTKKIITETERYLSTFGQDGFVFTVTDSKKKKYKKLFRLFSLEIVKFTGFAESDIFTLSNLLHSSDTVMLPEITKKISALLESYYAAAPAIGGFLENAEALFANDFQYFNHSKLLTLTRKLKNDFEIFKGAIENEKIHTLA